VDVDVIVGMWITLRSAGPSGPDVCVL